MADRSAYDPADQVDALLHHAPVAIAFFDSEFRLLAISDPEVIAADYDPAAVVGRTLESFAPNLWGRVAETFRRVRDTGVAETGLSSSGLTPDARYERHWQGSVFPVGDGPPYGIGAIIENTTSVVQAKLAWRFLARITSVLSEPSIEIERGLQTIANAMIPTFGDLCSIAVADSPVVAFAHVDPDTATRLRTLGRRAVPTGSERAVVEAIGRKTQLIDVVTEEMAASVGFTARADPAAVTVQREVGAQSVFLVPLIFGDHILGLMSLAYTHVSERRYSDSVTTLVEQVGRRVSDYLERDRLRAEAARARERMQILARLGEMVGVELDVRSRFYTLPRILLPDLADVCAIFRVDGERVSLLNATSLNAEQDQFRNQYGPWPSRSINDDTPAAVAARTQEPVLIERFTTEAVDRIARNLQEGAIARLWGVKSLIAVPLLDSGEVRGVLALGFADSGRSYTVEDIPMAEEVGRRVSAWMANAIRFERQRATAEHLQRALLPDELPRLCTVDVAVRYVPGAVDVQVGGDWYDTVVLPDGRVMLVIGDVVGHGAHAAATMGRFRTVIEMQAITGASPGEILASANEFAHGRTDRAMATAIVAVLDPATGRCVYARAGHLPPVVHSGRTCRLIEGASGPPIGAIGNAQYSEDEFVLERGEQVLLCTDGLFERRGTLIDDRIADLVAAFEEASADVEMAADQVLDTMTASTAAVDDVALVIFARANSQTAFDLRVAPDFAELKELRATVTAWCQAGSLGAQLTDDIVLTTNELVANGIEHGGTAVYVAGRIHADHVRIEVRDSGRWRTKRRPAPGSESPRGRGTVLAENLSSRRTLHAGPNGTTVIVDFAIGTADASDSAH
ncbi:MAG: SpoIIE family protein phosphatase [Acidimicrobiia bacterium]